MVEVRHRRVELIELFYDLIYVYAIARLTESVVDARSLEAGELARYVLAAFIILQSWLYLTNYVNRYA
ncbi:low temperature requirement protein A [Bifidobacterium cuniculi]|uniref:low temperature requirement protein A n=1 Tax=Bifidobacterium cuniculi TaxID=1688 RepID=UPI000B1F0620|nr:low temperature requirement protein A [Bifidobacterium cuniculi]